MRVSACLCLLVSLLLLNGCRAHAAPGPEAAAKPATVKEKDKARDRKSVV